MHRAGIDRAFRKAGCTLRGFIEILRRVGFELREASARAEIIRSTLVLMAVLRRMRINQHPANGISHAFLDPAVALIDRVMAHVSRVVMVFGG